MMNGKMPKVEKGVPLPEEHTTRGGWINALKPGQSFVVPLDQENTWQAAMHATLGRGKWRMHRITGKRTRFWRVA